MRRQEDVPPRIGLVRLFPDAHPLAFVALREEMHLHIRRPPCVVEISVERIKETIHIQQVVHVPRLVEIRVAHRGCIHLTHPIRLLGETLEAHRYRIAVLLHLVRKVDEVHQSRAHRVEVEDTRLETAKGHGLAFYGNRRIEPERTLRWAFLAPGLHADPVVVANLTHEMHAIAQEYPGRAVFLDEGDVALVDQVEKPRHAILEIPEVAARAYVTVLFGFAEIGRVLIRVNHFNLNPVGVASRLIAACTPAGRDVCSTCTTTFRLF